jgi:hypothetical protein
MPDGKNSVRPFAVLIKALALFLVFNFTFALPIFRGIYRLSLYNTILPGRYGFGGAADLDLMMAANMLSAPKEVDEFRVFLVGDSSVAGAGLDTRDKVVYLLDALHLQTCDGKTIRVYSLGSPFKSFVKDLLILDRAMEYRPDLIVEFVTLEAFTTSRQLPPTVIQQNPQHALALIDKYHLDVQPPEGYLFPELTQNHTLIGERSKLSAWLSENLDAVRWASGFDDRSGEDEEGAVKNPGDDDLTFNGWTPPVLPENELRFDLMRALFTAAGDIPVLVVNEPILILAAGRNSDIRYDVNYPRWAYDQYRRIMIEKSAAEGWPYLDLWDAVPAEYFGNSSFHRQPQGERIVADQLIPVIQTLSCP